MVLCCKARLDAAKLLLKKGADPTMCDKNGWNSLFYAIWGEVYFTCTYMYNIMKLIAL